MIDAVSSHDLTLYPESTNEWRMRRLIGEFRDVAGILCGGAHGFASRSGFALRSDLMYSIRSINCSSLSCPLNVGMIGG